MRDPSRHCHRLFVCVTSLLSFDAASAPGAPPPAVGIELKQSHDALVLKTGDAPLAVSTKCPQFVFEQMTLGEGAAGRVVAGHAETGDPVEIAFVPMAAGSDATFDVRLVLQWSPSEQVLRKWARFRVRGPNSLGILREIVLDTLSATRGATSAPASQSDDAASRPAGASEGQPQSHPVFLDGFFVGIEFPIAATRTRDGRTTLAYHPGLRVTPGTWYESRRAVYGIGRKGQEIRAFQRYIAANRPPPRGLHVNYNSWWTSPVPYTEADILKLLGTFEKKLYRPYGVSFDTFTIDLGWTNPQSLWEIDRSLFPNAFTGIQRAAARMNTHLGLWISPSNHYTGAPGDMHNGWADASEYETFRLPRPGKEDIRLVCLAGQRYGTALRERLVEMVTRYGVRQIKFDGYSFFCPAAGHGHAPGELSADAVAEGIISVFDAVRRAAPDTWLEATCFGWNPSPWWLFHVNSVIGTFGDDAPRGRVPAPVYRESYTTARDYFNLQGAARLPIPIAAQEVLGVIHQTSEPFLNDAVMSVMRGHMFQPAYVNPAYMNESRWRALADLVKWARRHADVLAETQPLLPQAWAGGRVPRFSGEASMPREPYGYAHWTGEGGLVGLRNPWIAPQDFALVMAPRESEGVSESSASKAAHALTVISIYPESRLYGQNLHAGDTLRVPLAPYETVVLAIGPQSPVQKIPGAAEATGRRIRTANVRSSLAGVRFEGAPATQPFGHDWTSAVGAIGSAIRMTLEADVEVDAPQAEILILLEGPRPPDVPLCRVFVNGNESHVSRNGSQTGWCASLEPVRENWLFLRSPLEPRGKSQAIRIEVFTDAADAAVSAWIWATKPPPGEPSTRPDTLPAPELVPLDAAALLEPIELHQVPPETIAMACPVERIDGVYLDTLEPVSASQGWGTLQRNRSVWEKPMTIAGKPFLRGLGTHAPSRLVYSLDGGYRRFQAWVGADGATSGSVTFEVRVDGIKRWGSALMTRGSGAERVDVDITGSKTLELISGDSGNGYTGDHADWADARLLR